MFVTVHHQIRDSKQWANSTKHIIEMMEQGKLPKGLKGLMFLPSADGRQADCLWEADSVEHLKSFIDEETGSAAKNEFIRLNDRDALGLPCAELPATDAEKRTMEEMHLGI